MQTEKKTGKGKPTITQLENRIKRAVIMVDKTKDDKEVYFDDKGVRLFANDEYAIVSTLSHSHVFHKVTTSGVSRPWLYIQRVIEIALANDCAVKDSRDNWTRSFSRLMDTLKEKEDKTEYNTCWYVNIYLFNIFAPLYEIDETATSAFLTYETYLHNIARNSFLLDEHTKDVTNKEFVDKVLELERSYMEEMESAVLLKAKSDEERIKEEIAAMSESQLEQDLQAN